jgi:hypothetical protein
MDSSNDKLIDWLLEGDPAIGWQTQRDLVGALPSIVEDERLRVASEGWGVQLLALQEPSGRWGGGLYSPKWISTHYTMFSLRFLGLPQYNPKAHKACQLLLEAGYYRDGGINFSASIKYSETCITGMVLSILAYFRYPDRRIHDLVEHLVDQQMADGGWNCQSYRGATHSSFHTTISVLEGLHHYALVYPEQSAALHPVQSRAHEFLLIHRLYRSHHTGQVVNPAMTRFPFPPRWHYDVLRALDYFQAVNAQRDERFEDAIQLLLKKRKRDGRWFLNRGPSGRIYFDLEKAGGPSRWNTLRALRVLRWWEG